MYVTFRPVWIAKEKRWKLDIMRDGKRKVFTSSIPKKEGKQAVIAKALEWIDDPERNKYCTFAELFPLFLQYYREKMGNNTSYHRYVTFGNNHLMPRLGKKIVSKITLDQWQACISQAQPLNGRTEPLSKKTLGAIKETISAFLKWAKPRHYIDEDFTSELFIPKTATVKGKDILQLADIENWFNNPTGLWYERALQFQLMIGARPGEVLGLKRSDYNGITNVLTIQRSLNNKKQITPGKNKNAHRSIRLSGPALELLQAQLKATAHLDTEWLFCGSLGQLPSPQKYYQTLEVICSRLGLPKISPYCLRHTFFSLVEGYLPSRMMKAIFGHSEATDSHILYGDHEVDGELIQISQRLDVTPLYKISM